MHKAPGDHRWLRQGVGLDRRLDKMVAAGRLTDDEAARLRAAKSAVEREDLARAIQVRHARRRIDEAVENGRLTEAEAKDYVDRLDSGEDLKFLRGLRRRSGDVD
jgi:hypothetical protein